MRYIQLALSYIPNTVLQLLIHGMKFKNNILTLHKKLAKSACKPA